MKTIALGMLGASALIASALAAQAQATDDPGVEFAFMPRAMTVTLLNDGGKYAIDLKLIPQGGTCQMDKDALIARVAPGAGPGTTRVHNMALLLSSGGCPFLTTFDLPDADYGIAHASFLEMKDDAWKKVDEVKKSLGDKWNEVIGKIK